MYLWRKKDDRTYRRFTNDRDCICKARLLVHLVNIALPTKKRESSRTRLGQILSTTAFLSSLSAYSERLSKSAIRVPRSGLAKSLISGPRITLIYSSGDTFLPNCNTSGTIVAAEAPPYSSAVTKDGRIRNDANSGGNEEADSFRVLHASVTGLVLCTTRYHSPKKCGLFRFAAQVKVVEAGADFYQSIPGKEAGTFASRLRHTGVQECLGGHATLGIRIKEFLEREKDGRRDRATRRRLRRWMRWFRRLGWGMGRIENGV